MNIHSNFQFCSNDQEGNPTFGLIKWLQPRYFNFIAGINAKGFWSGSQIWTRGSRHSNFSYDALIFGGCKSRLEGDLFPEWRQNSTKGSFASACVSSHHTFGISPMSRTCKLGVAIDCIVAKKFPVNSRNEILGQFSHLKQCSFCLNFFASNGERVVFRYPLKLTDKEFYLPLFPSNISDK